MMAAINKYDTFKSRRILLVSPLARALVTIRPIGSRQPLALFFRIRVRFQVRRHLATHNIVPAHL